MALAASFGQWPYTAVTCYRCQTDFCMADALYKARLADHLSFWCPNGHEQHFTGESEEKKRIRDLEAAVARERANAEHHRKQREWAESRTKGANIAAGKAKAALGRTIARVHAGVCPHCNRTFQQLAKHMATKHHGK